MRRREFISLVGGAVVWPLAARGRQPDRIRRIGVLHPETADAVRVLRRLSVLREALLRLGWTEGTNIRIESRFGNNDPLGRLPKMASELVELQPEVIFTVSSPAALALKRVTQTIPIVFVGVGNPLSAGLVSNLARPASNVTGFSNTAASLSSKRLELLKEISPGISRAALMFNPDTSLYRGSESLTDFLTGATRLVIEPIVAEVRNQAEIEAAIAALAREPRGGLVVGQDIFNLVNRASIIALTGQYRVPAIYPSTVQSLEGGLLSYGAESLDDIRQAASYVSRILKGEKPGDLPVQQPTKYKLVINLKTAKALGLNVSPVLLARADQVIE